MALRRKEEELVRQCNETRKREFLIGNLRYKTSLIEPRSVRDKSSISLLQLGPSQSHV